MKKILFIGFLILSFMLQAQDEVPNPGGVGTDGYGAPASPIDMYIYVLGVIGFVFTVYFANKYRKKQLT